MHCSLPGSFVHGNFQTRILEWVAISFFQGIFLTQGSNLCLLYIYTHTHIYRHIYICIYTYINISVYSHSKSHLVMEYNLLCMLLDSACYHLVDIYSINIHKEYWSVVFLLCIRLVFFFFFLLFQFYFIFKL